MAKDLDVRPRTSKAEREAARRQLLAVLAKADDASAGLALFLDDLAAAWAAVPEPLRLQCEQHAHAAEHNGRLEFDGGEVAQ